jgi:predicted  nucleic acid-binding Zn-ribbon protein
MSQTETILLILLGFSLGALVALFFGRFIWNLGLRFGARRMRKQVPSTVAGLQTERDQLRAEFAMLSQRLGARLEEAKLAAAEQMAEVTRHRNRVDLLISEQAERERALAALQSEAAETLGRAKAVESDLAAAKETIAALHKEIAQRDRIITSLQQTGTMPKPDLPPDATTEDRLRARIEHLTGLSRPAEPLPAEPQLPLPAPPVDAALAEGLEKAERDTDDLRKELERLDAEWNKKLDELGEVPPDKAGEVKPGAVANVISLANRIRALKNDIAS